MSSCSKGVRVRSVAAVILIGSALSGCGYTDLYLDRRETIHLGADDAVSANKVVHMIDPWPPASGNRYIPGDGHRVATAVERYRTGKVIKPVGTGTSSSYQPPDAAAAPALAPAPVMAPPK